MKKSWHLIPIFLLLLRPAWGCTLPEGKEIVIGCTYECDSFYRLRLQYAAWSLGYEVRIVSLPKEKNVEAGLNAVHGLLAPGGADIHPKYYLDRVSPELKTYTEKNLHLAKLSKEGEERDPFEYELMSKYSSLERYKRLPLLGICRGMQMMTVVQGIPLYLDLEKETELKNRSYSFDKVEFEKNTGNISRIYASDVTAFKLHHQGLRVPYFSVNQASFPNVKITGFSNDRKIAEVIEYQHRPAIGVQYHPEKSFPGAADPILKWLLTQSCEYRNSIKDVL